MHLPREFKSSYLALLFFVAAAALGSVGCKGGDGSEVAYDAGIPDARPVPDAAIAPVFFNPRDDLSDDELAGEALALLGFEAESGQENCENCHGLTRTRMRYWQFITETSLAECFSDLELLTPEAAQAAINCMREFPADSASSYHTENVAIFSTGVHLPWFEFAFQRAYGDNYQTELQNFIARVGMPRGELTPFTQDQFDIVASWFTRGIPELEAKLPEDPAPTECLPFVTSPVAAHVGEMAMSGWRAVNEQNNLLMFGCDNATDATECLSTYPAAGDDSFSTGWAANVTGQQLRVLRESGYRSNFWTRSSADGRFVANGASTGGANSRIVDLQRNVSIPASGLYDPGFLPDNTGFMFQRDIAYMCDQNLLVSEPSQIIFQSEPSCSATQNVGLYQHIGGALDGGDYWAVDGQFVSDNGGREPQNSDPRASFSAGSELRLTPLIHDGDGYVDQETIAVPTPYEGDAVISSSSELVISRLRGPNETQLGFVMRKVNATPTKTGYDVELTEIARYCFNGGKPAFSYDDRWLVLHHYIGDDDAVDLGFTGPNDPAFADYGSLAGSNIYLVDTLTGAVTRITNMQPGQYALFPHFRSDGWIYFMVRTLGQGSEYIVASDAALRLESTP